MENLFKTELAIDNFVNDSSAIRFNTGSQMLGNNLQQIGKPSISSSSKGFYEPNVNDALEQIAAMAPLGINSVVVNTDGVSPAPAAQVDRISMSGRVIDLNKAIGETVKVNFYGFYVDALNGDTAADFVVKVQNRLRAELAKNNVFASVIIPGQDKQSLEIRYVDNQSHVLPTYSNQGITFRQNVVSPAKQGYGTWLKIGTETKTLTGANAPITLHYFKRTS